MSKYIFVNENYEEKFFKELYTIVEDADEGSWADEHKIAESDNVFDLIESDRMWAVEGNNYTLLKVLHIIKKFINSKVSYVFSDFKNCLSDDKVDYIYHKDKQSNWQLVWMRE